MSGMSAGNGARTPEELEALLEDTLLLGDLVALAALFEDGAAFVVGGQPAVRGSEKIARRALATWRDEDGYVAHAQSPIQARDIGLIVADRGLNVMRRGTDGMWRYVLLYLSGQS